jgi:hypothetical protein
MSSTTPQRCCNEQRCWCIHYDHNCFLQVLFIKEQGGYHREMRMTHEVLQGNAEQMSSCSVRPQFAFTVVILQCAQDFRSQLQLSYGFGD